MSSKRRNKKRMIMDEKRTAQETCVQSGETVNQQEHQNKKQEIKRALFLQYNNLEFSDKLMFEAALNDYCDKTGTAKESILSINLYVKPEEGKAYYVINENPDQTGSIEL